MLESFFWFFCIQLVQTSWMASLDYQGIYILFVYGLIAVGVALQFAFFCYLLAKTPCLQLKEIVFFSSLWVLLEWIRLHLFCGFAFNFLGILLSGSLLSLQWASLSGVLGMSFWVIFTNLLGLNLLQRKSVKSLVYWLCCACLPYLFGVCHLHAYRDSEEKSSRVLLVQMGMTPSQKYLLKGRESEFVPAFIQWEEILHWISKQARGSLDLIVFPEASFPTGFDQCLYPEKKVKSLFLQMFGEEVFLCFPEKQLPFARGNLVSNAYFAKTIANFFKAEVLIGLDYQSQQGAFYNSVFYFSPSNLYPSRYDKQILLPFAEYMPFSSLKFLSSYYGVSDFFEKGTGSCLFVGKSKISPSICYEELFSHLVWKGKNLGADLLVNFTNDGWYPGRGLAIQHYTHGRIRSVENGTPHLRACNIGITAAIDSYGREVAKVDESYSGILQVDLPLETHPTLFSRWGESALIWLCFLYIVFETTWEKRFFLVWLFQSRKKRRPTLDKLCKK